MLQAVVDTNMVVSGVLAGGAGSPTGRIVDALLSGRLRFVLSEALLAEYRRVLLRPAIAWRHGLNEGEIDRLLEGLVVNAMAACCPVASPAELASMAATRSGTEGKIPRRRALSVSSRRKRSTRLSQWTASDGAMAWFHSPWKASRLRFTAASSSSRTLMPFS